MAALREMAEDSGEGADPNPLGADPEALLDWFGWYRRLAAGMGAFFLLRVLHSIVHCTINRVMLRFQIYALSSLALWFMLGRVVIDVFSP